MSYVASEILSIHNLSKSYFGNLALDSLNLSLESGEMHVLVGENGSGKSTLIKVLSGYHVPDPGGEVDVNSVSLPFGSATSSYRLGCRFVHQDLGLLPTLSILENLALGTGYPTALGTIRNRVAAREAKAALLTVGLDLEPRTRVGALSAAERTGVAVARALRPDGEYPARLLVLDEPTATLPVNEVDNLLAMIKTAASSGVGILFVTHHLEEVFRIADSVTVLRDGKKIATAKIQNIDQPTLVGWIIGSAMEEEEDFAERIDPESVAPVISVQGLETEVIAGVEFSVQRGEILGIAGLTGSGRESLLGAIFGATMRVKGEVVVNGERLRPGRPDLAIAAGAAFLPSDRKVLGGIMTLSARENLTLPRLKPFWKGMRMRRRLENVETKSWFARLQIRPADDTSKLLAAFSGGNQQKILFGKWIRLTPIVLLIDEPTQGVDVGAKAALHRELLNASASGMAVIVSSTEVAELASICHRVLVMREGRVAEELRGSDANVATITRSILSGVSVNARKPT